MPPLPPVGRIFQPVRLQEGESPCPRARQDRPDLPRGPARPPAVRAAQRALARAATRRSGARTGAVGAAARAVRSVAARARLLVAGVAALHRRAGAAALHSGTSPSVTQSALPARASAGMPMLHQRHRAAGADGGSHRRSAAQRRCASGLHATASGPRDLPLGGMQRLLQPHRAWRGRHAQPSGRNRPRLPKQHPKPKPKSQPKRRPPARTRRRASRSGSPSCLPAPASPRAARLSG